MTYRSATIKDILSRINRTYFLPAIQRPFVWESDQIVDLFDSILRGYPISSFLFWEVQEENWQNWDIYKFIDNFRYGNVHNEPATPSSGELTLVLDGQQRLTSLLIGLSGSYTIRQKYKRNSNPSAFITQRLYIDLLQDGTAEESETDVQARFGLKFADGPPRNTADSYWILVGKILQFDSIDSFDQYKDRLLDQAPSDMTRGDKRMIEKNLDRLYRVIWKEEVISYYTEKAQDYDRVLNIFIRANDGGTKLSKSDLLLSMITSKWSDRNARDEIYDFVEELNSGMQRKNDFDKDFVLRAALIVSDLDCTYKVENFTPKNLAIMQQRWPHIRTAVRRTVALVNHFGIDRDTLTSANALMPIIYYVSRADKDLLGTDAFDARNAESIRIWLIAALLGNAFGGAVNSTLAVSRKLVRDGLEFSNDFPSKILSDGLKLRGRVIGFDDIAIQSIKEVSYSKKQCFLALSLLYDLPHVRAADLHIDHIFPKAIFGDGRKHESKIRESYQIGCSGIVDNLGNLQLLLGRENLEKGSMRFEQWMDMRDPGYLRIHLIPEDSSLWIPLRFQEFVREREKLITQRLRRILPAAG